jgi:ubiquinone/menaquinone biosynthesis C-methylase UbiE
MSDAPANVSPQRIMGMVWGFAAPLTLEAAVKHGVFDTLDERAKTLDEITKATGASKRGLRAILNTLVAIEVLAKNGELYSLTPESSAFLVSHKPAFQGAILRHISTQLLPAWLKLSDVVKTGRPAASVNQESTGAEFFAEFVESIAPLGAGAAAVLADHLFSNLQAPASVLDIAAGSGIWGITMAKKSPKVSVTAVDWAGVIPITRRCAEKAAVSDRFRFVEGDLKDADFGQGHSLAILGAILHSEGEARSRALLKKVHGALKPGGVVMISEFIPDEDRRGPVMPVMFAINMLVNTDEGDTFTYSEMSAWLAEAGFTNIRQLKTPSVSPLILADKK